MNGRPPYTVRTGDPGLGDIEVDDLDHAVDLASDHIDEADDPVEVIDADGNIVFSQSELVGRILRMRTQAE